MSLMKGFLLTIFLFYTCSAQVPGFGKCPQPPTKSDFDAKQYQGVWYEVERYFPIAFELGTKCGQANYTLLENGHVRVENTGYRSLTGSVRKVVGDAVAPDETDPGKLEVSFPDASAFAKGPYWVLFTDYASTSVVYSCTDAFGLAHADIVWILGREKALPQETLDAIHNRLQILGIRTFFLRGTDQNNCPY